MRRTALITGASAGIGAAFAHRFAERGHDLVLTARREDRLRDLAALIADRYSVEVLVIPADLALPTAPVRILDRVAEAGRQVDVLVNNAGYGLPGTFQATKWEDQRDFMQVMFAAPCELVHRCLPAMVQRGYGRILNVASLVSFTPGSKGHTLYGPLKAGLMRFSEAIHAETDGTGVHVTALCPGLTYSEFHDANGTRSQLGDVPKFMWQSAEEVVAMGYEALEQNRVVMVTGGVNKMLVAASKIIPDPIARKIMSSQSKRFRNQGA
jgi:short-subunit dehydrogenase